MSTLLLRPNAFDFSAIFGNFLSQWYYYVGLLVSFVLIFLYFIFNKKPERNSLNATQKITYYAVFTALCVAVNALSITVTNILSISFVVAYCFVCGYVFGAKGGFVIGFLGDLIGGIIFPKGAYMPMLALANGLFGFIPGVIFDNFKINKYIGAIISFAFTLVLCTVILNTLGLYLAYGIGKETLWAYLWARLPFQTAVTVGNFWIACLIINVLPKILSKNKFLLS